MTYRAFFLLLFAVFSLGRPGMAATFWSTFGGNSIGAINTSTGVATIVGPSGKANTYGLAEDPTTHILYASFDTSIGTVNKTTGAVTTVGDTGHGIYGIVFDASGQMWAANTGTGLYKINKATGAATLVGTTLGATWMDLSFNGSTLYGVSGTTPNVTLYTINTSTGVGTVVAAVTGACSDAMGIGFDSDGTLYAAAFDNGNFCTMNPLTGFTTLVGATGQAGPHGGEIEPATQSVPTLSEWAKLVLACLLVITGCVGLHRFTTRKAA